MTHEEYLAYRGRESKTETAQRRKQLLKQKIFSDDGYLFILRQIDDSYLQNHDEEKRKLSHIVVQKMFRAMSTKAKQNTGKGIYNTIRSHTMRKYFNSALLNAGCDSFHVEFFMGHGLDNTRAAYFRAQPKELREIYAKYIPYLTIQKENSIEENPEFKKLNEEMQHLKGENEKLKLDRFENEAIKRLEGEMRELKEAQKSRETAKEDFKEIIEDDRKYWAEVDQIAEKIAKEKGITLEEAEHNYNICPPMSEKLHSHFLRMHNDVEYRTKYKDAFRTVDITKRKKEIGEKLYNTFEERL